MCACALVCVCTCVGAWVRACERVRFPTQRASSVPCRWSLPATYPHEFNPSLPVVNLPDNWTRPSSHLLASSASCHQGQYAMWNHHHLTAGSPQQPSPSPYPAFLRSPASYALPPTPESLPDTSQLYYETPLTSGQGHVDAATASLVSSFQSALAKSSTSTWNPLTPSSI